MTHPAWSVDGPKWVTLAPGVRWLLKQPDGAERQIIAAEVAGVMARVWTGRAALEELGVDLDPEGPEATAALDLGRLSGMAAVLTAVYLAQRCLKGWEGIDDPETGQPLDHTDPEIIRNALVHGAPPQGRDLLSPFLSWAEGPRQPMAAESVRLRKRAKDFWSGGRERCAACVETKETCALGGSAPKADDPTKREICPQLINAPTTAPGIAAWSLAASTPGLWLRAGMEGSITGLDHGAALMAFEAQCGRTRDDCDHGAAFEAFRAIEAGALEAFTEAAELKKDH